MAHYSRVLVGVDHSRAARDAFDFAVALSARDGAQLVAVHAVPPDQPFSRHARARIALSERLRQRAARARVEFRERVQNGDPAEILLLHARALRPDVIVMGTHQRRGMDRFRQGSVSERVATQASVPVLLVPRRDRADVTNTFRHVAVAVDFSAASDRAIEQALAIANVPGGRVTLIHVVPGYSSIARPHLYGYGFVEYQEDMIRDARRRLRLAVAGERTASAVIDTRVESGDVTTEINRVVDGIGADLLVVGVPKRGAVSTALFGRTSARLLRSVSVPMLAVPDTGRTAVHPVHTPAQIAA